MGPGVDDLAPLVAALSGRVASVWPELAWRDSRLTSDGFPAEFAVSSVDRQLRCTIDPAPPELPEASRLGLTAAMAAAGGSAVPNDWLVHMSGRQAGQRLRWGGWLGLRQHGHRLWPKLYAESHHGPTGPAGGRPTMSAYDAANGAIEDYYQLPTLGMAQLHAVVGGNADAQLAALRACLPVPLGVALDWIGFGASVAGPARRVTLYLRTSAMPGIDVRVAERFDGLHPKVAAAGMLGISADGQLRLGASAKLFCQRSSQNADTDVAPSACTEAAHGD